MDNDYITRKEHDEFARRMDTENQRRDDENNRQNHRLDLLEKNAEETRKLTVSVERMAVSTEQMAKELGKQGERLDAIEQRPGKAWDSLKMTVLAAIASGIVGILIGAVVAALGGG